MRSPNRLLRKEASDVLDAVANVLAPVAVLEHRLRVFATLLRDSSGESTGRQRRPQAPKPTVEFSELDSARADRALAHLGVRRTR